MADTKNKQLFHDIAKQLAKRHGEEQCPADVVRQISESVHLFQLAGSWPVVAADSKAPAWKRPLAYIIVRHGATEWSANGRHTSRTDLPLTTEGECEALIDGALLNGALLDVSKAPVQCFYSSLQRAKQTGQLAAPQYAAEAVVTDLLREWFYGDYEGLLTSEINKRLNRDEETDSWDIVKDGAPNGETSSDVSKRADQFIALTNEKAAGKIAVCFTHGHMSRAVTARLLGMPIDFAARLQNDTASIALIRWRKTQYVLDTWNLRPPRIRLPGDKTDDKNDEKQGVNAKK